MYRLHEKHQEESKYSKGVLLKKKLEAKRQKMDADHTYS